MSIKRFYGCWGIGGRTSSEHRRLHLVRSLIRSDDGPPCNSSRNGAASGISSRQRATKDGPTRYGLFSAEILQLQNQRVLLTVMNDITEQRLAEDALRQSEERNRLLVETIPQIAWRSSADGLDVDCNRRWFEYTGQTPDQVRAQGWLAAVHTDDLLRVTERMLRATNTRQPYELEYRLRRAADGSYRWHLVRAIPAALDENGQVICWFGSATDIEDLKRARDPRNSSPENNCKGIALNWRMWPVSARWARWLRAWHMN